MTLDRRAFLAACGVTGIASPLFPGILYTMAAQAQEAAGTDQSKPPKITPEMIDQAAVLADVGPFTAEQKQMMLAGLIDVNGSYKAMRKLQLPNSVAPAFVFHPLPAAGKISDPDCEEFPHDEGKTPIHVIDDGGSQAAPANIEDLAFATVTQLSGLLRT